MPKVKVLSVFVLLALLLRTIPGISAAGELPQATTSTEISGTPYVFPITPQDEEWRSFRTHDEMLAAVQIPLDVLASETTEVLLETVLDYPLAVDLFAYDNPQMAFDIVVNQFIRKKPGLDEWAMEEAPLKGRLALFDRCLCIVSDDQTTNYTPIWPADYQVRLRNGDIEIVNGFEQVVTRVGEAVDLDGGKIPVMWDLEGYRKLRDDLPGECKGPYWIVKE